MYYDFVSASREGWKYTYKGKDLQGAARRRHLYYLTEEFTGRQKLAEYVRDIKVSQNDQILEDLKRRVTENGKLREQCAVFLHEFTRSPDKEFMLSLGDVVFFELFSEDIPSQFTSASSDQ